jgi:hypothetical protein
MDEQMRPELQADHPLRRPASADDPMSLSGMQVEGDPLVMIDALVEEFARIGHDATSIHELFTRPHFQATWQLTQRFGEDVVRARIEKTIGRCGVFGVTTTHPDLIDDQLDIDIEQQEGEPENV